jgi:hypothetical protein
MFSDLPTFAKHGQKRMQKRTSCYRSANKLSQIFSQAVDKLCSHSLFPVVVTSLEHAVNRTCNKLDGIIRLVTLGCSNKSDTVMI